MIPDANKHSQEEILSKLKQGNIPAFSSLYDTYSGALYGFIYQLCNNEDTCEKIFLESFSKIWAHIREFDPSRQRLFTWMLGIVRATAAETLHTEKINIKSHTQEATGNVNRKDALSLVYFKGLSSQETAAALNISEKELNTQLHSEIKALRATVKDK